MRKHRVVFLSPGTFFDEQSSCPIPSWDIDTACEMARGIEERYGATPYGFYFTTVLTAEPITDGEGGMLNVIPKEVDRSGTYFITGELRTLDEVIAANDPQEKILRSNMEINDYPIVVVNRNSYLSVHPFQGVDVLVDWSGKVLHRGSEADLVAYRQRKIEEYKADLAQERTT